MGVLIDFVPEYVQVAAFKTSPRIFGVDDCMVKAISPQPWEVAADTKGVSSLSPLQLQILLLKKNSFKCFCSNKTASNTFAEKTASNTFAKKNT